MNTNIKTAIYARRSHDEDTVRDNESINDQIELVRSYINKRDDLQLAGIYADNGWSGTNFDRPEFNRMIGDVTQGKIECIVVKDLSRFGRDYLETGYYLETFFPDLQIRFISINDNYDSGDYSTGDELIIPLKNMINNLYAKDISKKIISSRNARKQSHCLKLSKPSYGYKYSEDQMHYEEDLGVSKYVRLMFQWRSMGLSLPAIQERLEYLGAETPMQRMYQICEKKPKTDEYIWRLSTVRKVLGNPVYSGDVVLNRSVQALYKGIPKRRTSEDEWEYVKDQHIPLVTRLDYEKVRERIKEDREHYENTNISLDHGKDKLINTLTGKVFCMHCGQAMQYVRRNHGLEDFNYGYYVCVSPGLTHKCAGVKMQEKLLKRLLMINTSAYIRNFLNRPEVIESLEAGNGCRENSRRKILYQVENLADNLKKAEEEQYGMYEKYVSGALSSEDFKTKKAAMGDEISRLKKKLEEEKNKYSLAELQYQKLKNKANYLSQFLESEVFNLELIQEMVERVEVGEQNHIRILFKTDDIFMSIVGGITNE